MLPITKTGQQAVVVMNPPKADGDRVSEHYWFSDLPAGIEAHYDWFAQRNAQGCDIYFSTGSFQDTAEQALTKWRGRRIANCVEQRSLFLDIDAKDYQLRTVQECKVALLRFLEASGLELPTAVINSGGGLHAYWTCDEAIPLSLWQVFADTLSATARHFGLKCDTQCTVDRCRVLRMPGFTNTKNGATVEVFYQGEALLSLEQIAAMLEPHIPLLTAAKPNIGSIVGGTQKASLAELFPGVDFSNAMNAGIQGNDFGVSVASWAKLREASDRGDGCQVIQWARLNQEQVRYDLWTGLLSIANHTDDVPQAVVDTCGGHPEFNFETNMAKASSFDGPRRCETLQRAAQDSGCANACQGCPFAGKIGSPVVLGQQSFKLKNEIEVVVQSVKVEQTTPSGQVVLVDQTVAIERRALPWPYTRVPGKPGVYLKVRDEDTDEWVTEDYPVLTADLQVTLVREGSDGVVAYYEYTHPMQGLRKFSIPVAALTSARSDIWPAILADNFVDMSWGAVDPLWRAKVSRFLQVLAKDYTDNVRAAKTVEQFGPIKDDEAETFVYGNLCYRAGKAPVEVVLSEEIADKWADKMIKPATTEHEKQERAEKIKVWNEGLQTTIGGYSFGPDKFILMTGFACPLAPFIAPARQRGGLIVPNSTEAGSGKTSMVARAVQMYVSGDEGFLVPDSTKMAFLEKNVAVAGALPVVWDELMKSRDERSNQLLHDLALSSTNRKPRERLTGTQTEVSWQSWFYGTTNPDPHEALSALGGSGHGAAARILSIKVDKSRFGTGGTMLRRQRAEQEFNDWCKKNGTIVGQAWIEHFMQNLPALKDRYIEWGERVLADCPTAYEDAAMRFMTTIIITTMVAAEEAARIGLHPFNLEELYAYAVTLLGDTIEHAVDAVASDEFVLADLLNTSIDSVMLVDARNALNNKTPHRELGIRVDIDQQGTCMVEVSQPFAKAWCAKKGVAYDILRANLARWGAQNDITKLARGTSLPQMTTAVYKFQLPAGVLEGAPAAKQGQASG